jgi:hypothetical protein
LHVIKILLQAIEARIEPTPAETSFGPADEKVIEQLRARFSPPEKWKNDHGKPNPGRI